MGSHSLLQGNLPDPGIEQKFLRSLSLAAGSLPLVPPGKTGFEHSGFKFTNGALKTYRCLGSIPRDSGEVV